MVITVKVQPRASKPGVERTGDATLKVRVHAAPEGGRANEEVVALLAGFFNVPGSNVRILRGATSRRKIVSIEE